MDHETSMQVATLLTADFLVSFTVVALAWALMVGGPPSGTGLGGEDADASGSGLLSGAGALTTQQGGGSGYVELGKVRAVGGAEYHQSARDEEDTGEEDEEEVVAIHLA